MARVTVEDCIDKVENRFELVLLAAHRARLISQGAPLTIDRDRDKNPVVALREIGDSTIQPDDLREQLIHSLQKYVEVDEPEAETVPLLSGTAAAPAPAAGGTGASTPKENPYGLRQLWEGQNGHADWVARGVMILLALMSIGTWYIFFMKFWEQQRVLGQSRQVERRFWASNNLNEGIDQLAKNSVFRTVAESGVRASSGGSGILNQNDWIAMSLNRQLEEINARLQGGVAFLASVGSTAPFVGLFGTVWGILNALIAIGVAGQASIDKVAGPVGEALIMTAIGLAVAVPAVLLYNYLVRRNKVINEKLRSFASDLQTYLVTKGR